MDAAIRRGGQMAPGDLFRAAILAASDNISSSKGGKSAQRITTNHIGKQTSRRQAGLREETTRKALYHRTKNRGDSQNGSQNIVWFPKTHSYLGTGIPLSSNAFRAIFGAVPKVPNGFAPTQMPTHWHSPPSPARRAGGAETAHALQVGRQGGHFSKSGYKSGYEMGTKPTTPSTGTGFRHLLRFNV